MLRSPFYLPSLKPSGNVMIGKSTYQAFCLDWSGFPPEAGPDGCVNVRFALGSDVSRKMRDLSLAAELSDPDGLDRWPADCCVIATAGCVSAIARLLCDGAIDPRTSTWMSRDKKQALSTWIATRIWRASTQEKRCGHAPESLASIGLPDEEERDATMSSASTAAKKVAIIEERFEKGDDGPPFDYQAVVAKDGRLYRVHVSLEDSLEDPSADLAVVRARDEMGRILAGEVSMDGPDGHDIVVIDDQDEQDYSSVEEFLADWVLNGLEQAPGMVTDLGPVPGLSLEDQVEEDLENDPDEESENVSRSIDPPTGIKVSDLAKEFGVLPKVVFERAKALNIEVRNYSTLLKPGHADRLRAKLGHVDRKEE